MRTSYTKWCRALSEIGVTRDRERKPQRGSALPSSQNNYPGSEGWGGQKEKRTREVEGK